MPVVEDKSSNMKLLHLGVHLCVHVMYLLSIAQANRSGNDLKRQQSQCKPPHCALPVVLQMTCRRWYLCLPLESWNQSRTTVTAGLEKMVSAELGGAASPPA